MEARGKNLPKNIFYIKAAILSNCVLVLPFLDLGKATVFACLFVICGKQNDICKEQGKSL